MASGSAAPMWKKIVAAILDFFTVFLVGGIVIANITGETTSGGFELDGLSALVLFAVIAAYFVLGHKFGGTLWQRILGTRK